MTPTSTDKARLGREKRREAAYKKRYGITIEEYDARLAAQGGVCALCGRPPAKRRLSIDHDHKTGAVRGLLCYRCNRALPYYVTIAWLKKAIAYIDFDFQEGEDDAGRTDVAGAGTDSCSTDSQGGCKVCG